MKLLVTAGPTREPIDPVRYLGNRSSGRMGYALAAAAAARGHEVLLVSGPVTLACPEKVERVTVETAEEMYRAVASRIAPMDIVIMSAAVADYRPAVAEPHKIKKGSPELTLHLVKTVDILGSAREEMGYRGYLVGFAAETNDLADHARAKLRRKQCDLVVANDVSRTDIGFDRTENEVVLFFADGRSEALPRMNKPQLADRLLVRIECEHAFDSTPRDHSVYRPHAT